MGQVIPVTYHYRLLQELINGLVIHGITFKYGKPGTVVQLLTDSMVHTKCVSVQYNIAQQRFLILFRPDIRVFNTVGMNRNGKYHIAVYPQ